jgi:molybdopterin-guanine dinucleotide biosynthesis protein A
VLLRELRDAVAAGATAAVARAGGRAQPLCAAYAPVALGVLAAAPADEPLTRTVDRLKPAWVDSDEAWLCNVNDADDLARASVLLGGG